MTSSANTHPGIRQRVTSGLIDLCLLTVAVGITTWLGLAVQGPVPETGGELFERASRLWFGNLLPVTVLVVTLAMAFCWSLMTATPGQLLMGCRVVRVGNGRPLSFVVALWRGLVLVLLGGPVGLPLVTAFVDRRRRGIHDWLSFSVVTYEDESRIDLDQWIEEIA